LSYTCTPNACSCKIIENMRTLQTQVKLRRLIRSTAEAFSRLRWQPSERRMADAIVGRLLGLAAEVRESWAEDALSGRPGEALRAFVAESLRTAELAITGAAQEGSDLELLRQDFERTALPLEVFLRGLDAEPALQRSA
jgi:hypothetical protein